MSNDVFHYTKFKTALEYILNKKEIRFSQMILTNDPRETKEMHLFSLLGIPPEQSAEKIYNRVHREAKNIKLKEWKVLCLSKDHPDLVSGTMSAESNPLLRGNFRPSMWAHYGSGDRPHDGVCLRFKQTALNERILQIFNIPDYIICSGEVEYNDKKLFEPPPFDYSNTLEMDDFEFREYVRRYFLDNFNAIFLLKSKDWGNEYEFRWLVHSPKDDYEYVSIDGILEEVMIGEEFPKVYEPSLIKLCSEMNVSAKKIGWFHGFPYEETIYPVK